MDTLQKIYIAYLGILAVFVCFIFWIDAKLRAERIRRIRENKASQTRYDELNVLFNEAMTRIGSLKYSNDSLNTLIEGNKVLIDSHEAKIAHLNNVINEKQEYIENLQGQIENLIKCISRTGIRGHDGVVRKCNIGHIQSVISGTHEILSKMKVKEVKPTRDWSVPQAFPEDYIVPGGIECISLIDDECRGYMINKNDKVTTIDTGNYASFIKTHRKDRREEGSDKDGCLANYELAPINPLDHPEHPQFNKK